MSKVISTTDANRDFSSIMRQVREGQSFVITSHGKAIAQITPADEKEAHIRTVAKAALFSRLRGQKPVNAGRWSREDLYEDGS